MAPLRELRRLFEAISRKDWDSAHSVAEHLAELEAKRGNRSAARVLRDSLRERAVATAAPASIVELGLAKRNNPARLCDVLLPKRVTEELQAVVAEFRHSETLQSHGFYVRRKLIFTGPPGCGKSLTAQAIANELNLSHFVVRFDAIIGSYLGQTAANLRHLFRFSETVPSVLLFDEIDALGKRRGNPTEVGELDRIVIALMQELELSQPIGLVIATSNIPEHLDHALWRRFDQELVFPAPNARQLRSFILRIGEKLRRRLPESVISLAVHKRSYAEAEAVVSSYFRKKLLSELNGANGTR